MESPTTKMIHEVEATTLQAWMERGEAIRIQEQRAATPGAHGLEALQIRPWMHREERVDRACGSFDDLHAGRDARTVEEHPQTCGRLRVTRPWVVLEAIGVGEDGYGHGAPLGWSWGVILSEAKEP